MTVEQLLIKRYKVIGPYPEMGRHGIEVGDILTDNEKTAVTNQNEYAVPAFEWETFPNIFKKLEWWEERGEGEPCDYIKNKGGEVFMFHKMKQDKALISNRKVEDHWEFLDILTPATPEEYTNYINSKQNG